MGGPLFLIEVNQDSEYLAWGFNPFLHGGESVIGLYYSRYELVLGTGAALQVAYYRLKVGG